MNLPMSWMPWKCSIDVLVERKSMKLVSYHIYLYLLDSISLEI